MARWIVRYVEQSLQTFNDKDKTCLECFANTSTQASTDVRTYWNVHGHIVSRCPRGDEDLCENE